MALPVLKTLPERKKSRLLLGARREDKSKIEEAVSLVVAIPASCRLSGSDVNSSLHSTE